MKRLAVLISNAGSGTNLQAIIDAIESKTLHAKIAVVVSDSVDAQGLARAKKHKLPTFIVDKNTDLTKLLKDKYNADYVCLAGWKQIIPSKFIDVFENRILNIHPGLVPDTLQGRVKNPDGTIALWNRSKLTDKAIQNFLSTKTTYAGSAVHYLSHEFDFGPVLKRVFEKIKSRDTVDSLYTRLKKKENKAYVEVLKKLCNSEQSRTMKKSNVLIVGSGGREHALGWKLAQSKKVDKVYFAPGNGGTSRVGENVSIAITEHKKIIEFVKESNVSLVVIGPDDSLAAGIVNDLNKVGIKNVFGPTKKAAQIEWSKAFTKSLLKSTGVPTATYKTFTDAKKAKKYLATHSYPVVIKASGLALGKGVIIAQTKTEAQTALEDMMVKKIFGTAGDVVVIEEFLKGQEISIHAFCDGKTAVLFPSSQDHKAIFAGDKGPNTGGMGTIAPVPWVTNKLMEEIKQTIILPILKALKKRGTPYKGLLYPGLMITSTGPKVIEINSRFGDPEVQSYMRLLKSDLYDILMACTKGQLKKTPVRWEKKSACCIVLASKGYPSSYTKGIKISGLNEVSKSTVVFHAGTKKDGEQIVTSGGRVLGVTAVGDTLPKALTKAYGAAKLIKFKGKQLRKDIGKRKPPSFNLI